MTKRGTRAVMVRNKAEAAVATRAATASGARAIIVSPPGAALFAGPIWFKALSRIARAESGAGANVTFVLDCADAPGAVLAAIRARVEAASFHGRTVTHTRLAAIAARAGVALMEPPTDVFDMTRNPGYDALLSWFSSPGVSLQSPRRSAKRTATKRPAPKPRGSRAKILSTGASRP